MGKATVALSGGMAAAVETNSACIHVLPYWKALKFSHFQEPLFDYQENATQWLLCSIPFVPMTSLVPTRPIAPALALVFLKSVE